MTYKSTVDPHAPRDKMTNGTGAIGGARAPLHMHRAAVMTGLAGAQQPSSSTTDVKSKLEQGMSAFRAHDYKRALAILNEVAATDPNNILAHNLAGNCSMEPGDFAAAIHFFERALQIEPDQPQNLRV